MQATRATGPATWRRQAAGTLSWAVLLAGWVGLGGFAQTLAPGRFSAFALLAIWPLALGAFAEFIGRLRPGRRTLQGLLLCAAPAAGAASAAMLRGGGLPALVSALLAWALLGALAFATAHACGTERTAAGAPPHSHSHAPAAAAGALLAWLCVGDIGNLNALGARLPWAALATGLLLCMLLPRHAPAARNDRRIELPGCSPSGWWMAGWKEARCRPSLIASLAMLSMMCSLPLTMDLCRGEWASPQLVLGLHFAAMFGPALLVVRRPGAAAAMAPIICAALLALGAILLLFCTGPAAWWGIALAHGAAWSVGCAAAPGSRTGRASSRVSPLAGAAADASLVLLFGWTVAAAGLQAIAGWHVALGLAGFLTLAAQPVWRVCGWRAQPRVQAYLRSR